MIGILDRSLVENVILQIGLGPNIFMEYGIKQLLKNQNSILPMILQSIILQVGARTITQWCAVFLSAQIYSLSRLCHVTCRCLHFSLPRLFLREKKMSHQTGIAGKLKAVQQKVLFNRPRRFKVISRPRTQKLNFRLVWVGRCRCRRWSEILDSIVKLMSVMTQWQQCKMVLEL